MRYIVTANEIKRYDAYTINQLGIPGEVLMERAALGALRQIERYLYSIHQLLSEQHFLVIAGVGNNGGDGLALARLLLDQGCNVDVTIIGNKEKMTPSTKLQYNILQNYGVICCDTIINKEYTIIVDALFGIGLTRDVTDEYAETIEKINSMDSIVVSLDIPSGIDADTGRVCGVSVKANLTVTFEYYKRGLFLYPGTTYAGKIQVVSIGITEKSFEQEKPHMFTYNDDDIDSIFVNRKADGNKGSFGKVLMLTGSEGMAGAAILCSKSCYRCGAGMVKVITPEENRVIIQESIPETMLLTYTKESVANKDWNQELKAAMEWASVLVAGPGIGKSDTVKDILRTFISNSNKPLILDADALNLLADDESIQLLLSESVYQTKRTVILTPHVGELSRLIKKSISDIKADFVKATKEAMEKYNCIIVSKDARTIVCNEKGTMFLNTAGNSGLATAGSGDVLTGIIGALCCMDEDPFLQASKAVFMHAYTADLLALRTSLESIMASDIIEVLGKINQH